MGRRRQANADQGSAGGGAALKPRERVLAAVDGQEVFPIPVDVFENAVYPQLEADLCRHFGLPREDHAGVLEALGAEIRRGSCLFTGPPLQELPGQIAMWPFKKVFRNVWGSWEGYETYSETIDRPLRLAQTVADVDAHVWPDPDWYDYQRIGWFYDTPDTYAPIPQWVERRADYARLIGGWNPVFSRVLDLFGMETGLMHMVQRPDLVQAAVAHIADFLELFYRRLAKAGQGYFDFLGFGDDFGYQGGMLIHPAKWRQYFLPVWKRLFPIAREHGMRASMHACGGIRPVLGDLIEAGLEVLEVVQVTAEGMGPAELKKEFGAHLTFHGALDSQHLLMTATPRQVRTEVRRLVETLGRGGRYIFCSMHFLVDGTPADNVIAMYDEAARFKPAWAQHGWPRSKL
jgi:uroporphyrinogen decarboxylase